MKPFILLTTFSLTICFLATHHNPWSFSLQILLTIFSLLPLLLNSWLVPGGFAWRAQSQTGPKRLVGPTGWPILGFVPQMGPLAHRNLANAASRLGLARLMAFSVGSIPAVISSHPETAREILRSPAFSDRPVKDSARLLMFERAIGFAPGSSEYWQRLRRIAAANFFSPRRITSFEGLRQRVAGEMAAAVWREGEEKGAVEVRKILQKGSLRNILESVFGSGLGQEGEELGLMVNEGYDLIAEFNLGDYFPLLGFLDLYGVKRRCYKLALKVKTVVGKLVEERKTEGGFNGRNDFLSVVLSLPKEDHLSEADMVAVLWEMIFRGTDTVAILLEWIMARMALHQDIQAKAQQEIDTCVGDSRHVRDSDIPNLPYLQAIVKEALRLHPPGPLLSWARLAVHDCHVDKFFIPAGTTAMVNMWAITHDPSIWKDPWTFRPERFVEEEISIMGSDLRLAPFGSGRRVCPGRALGLATVHLWLARLLHQFKWVPARPVDLSECLRLSMEMKKPLACCVTRRLSL
ncbi:Flavonoid 3'-monooxygenase [Bertholletia excelsa]